MDEAVWNLEGKLKISTQGAIALLVCTCSLVIGICIVATFRRKTRRKRSLEDQEPSTDNSTNIDWSGQPRAELGSVNEALTRSVRWSQKEKISPLLVSGDQLEADFGRQSRSTKSPVWQRPILIGEKCELPKFSGLILYDERGHATSSRG